MRKPTIEKFRIRKMAGLGPVGLLLLLPSAVCLAADAPTSDWRCIANGNAIPKEGYCDQPYVVVNGDGSWLCTMTTGRGHEGDPGQHIVATLSNDQGRSWSPLIDIEPADGPEASWVEPLIVPSQRVVWQRRAWSIRRCSPVIVPGERIFAFYTYNDKNLRTVKDDQGKPLTRVDTLGAFVFKYSDNGGRAWSPRRFDIPIPTTEIDRKNVYGGKVKFFWSICKPIVAGNSVFVAIHKVGNFNFKKGFMVTSEGFVFRSDNLLAQSDPAKITWTMLPKGDMGLRSPARPVADARPGDEDGHWVTAGLRSPVGPVADEQNLVSLSDGSLFCMYRTVDGHPCQAYSRDGGLSWTPPAHATYWPGGPKFRHPRACPRIWRTAEGKFLFWYHNNGWRGYGFGKGSGSRNIAWLSGGVEKGGFIHWSQPEIALYEDDWSKGPSYPDLVEQDGKYWITETQKTAARIHPIDRQLLEGMWNQAENREVAKAGLALSLEGGAVDTKQTAMPKLPPLKGGGFSLDLKVRFDDLAAGQVLLDWRDAAGKGGVVKTTPQKTIGIELSDGRIKAAWDCDPGLLETARTHRVTIIVDGGPRCITFLVDGRLCDGGDGRLYGWGRFDKHLENVNGGKLRIAPALKGELSLVRVYDRYLRNSEAVGNYQAGK